MKNSRCFVVSNHHDLVILSIRFTKYASKIYTLIVINCFTIHKNLKSLLTMKGFFLNMSNIILDITFCIGQLLFRN